MLAKGKGTETVQIITKIDLIAHFNFTNPVSELFVSVADASSMRLLAQSGGY